MPEEKKKGDIIPRCSSPVLLGSTLSLCLCGEINTRLPVLCLQLGCALVSSQETDIPLNQNRSKDKTNLLLRRKDVLLYICLHLRVIVFPEEFKVSHGKWNICFLSASFLILLFTKFTPEQTISPKHEHAQFTLSHPFGHVGNHTQECPRHVNDPSHTCIM